MLHVATRVLSSGGHSRVLDKWIRLDRRSAHAVVLTSQPDEIPQYISTTCAEFNIPILKLAVRKPRSSRAAELRSLARQSDIIVLHQHPEDSTPICAFASEDCPPVIFWNHAHYWFSFGSTIADVTVNSQEYFARQSKRFRFARQQSLLRSGTGLYCNSIPDKQLSRQQLGFPSTAKILLAMGSAHYFAPVPGANFFSAVDRVLARDPDAELLLVGPEPDSPYIAAMRNKDRVRACGVVSDPIPYYGAADYVLESLPHASIGSFLEAVYYGVAFPIAAFSPEENILRHSLDQFQGAVPRSRTEDAWVDLICNALKNPEDARFQASQICRRVRETEEWFAESIEDAYARALTAGHHPCHIGDGVDITPMDARVLAEQSGTGVESLDFLKNPFIRWIAKRNAVEAGLPGRPPSLVNELRLTGAHLSNAVSRIWRYQLKNRLQRVWKFLSHGRTN